MRQTENEGSEENEMCLQNFIENVKKRDCLQDVTSMGKIVTYISRKLVGISLRIEIKD